MKGMETLGPLDEQIEPIVENRRMLWIKHLSRPPIGVLNCRRRLDD